MGTGYAILQTCFAIVTGLLVFVLIKWRQEINQSRALAETVVNLREGAMSYYGICRTAAAAEVRLYYLPHRGENVGIQDRQCSVLIKRYATRDEAYNRLLAEELVDKLEEKL